MQSEADTIQEENTMSLEQVKIIPKENSDITGEISNMVANHTRAGGYILNIDTIVSEKIKSIEEMRKKNDKAMIEKTYL